MNKKYIEEIKRRYKRIVIAHPEGIITHHGDCEIYRADSPVCNCGLLHDLLPFADEAEIKKLYPKFGEELNKHYRTLDRASTR